VEKHFKKAGSSLPIILKKQIFLHAVKTRMGKTVAGMDNLVHRHCEIVGGSQRESD